MEIYKLKNGKEVEVRFPTPADYEAFEEYMDKLGHETIFTNQYPGKPRRSFPAFERALANNWFLVAFDGDKIAGLVSTTIIHPNNPYSGTVCNFGIHMLNKYKGNGLGSYFMKKMIDWAKSNKIHRIEGEVRHKNTTALALYQKHGFIIEGCKRNYANINGEWYHNYIIGNLLD